MTETFAALVLREGDDGPVGSIEQLSDTDLPDGDVTVDVDYSSLNYKDGMALTGAGRIVRSYPMVPGIDYAGTVRESADDRYIPGDQVVLTGWGVGERYWGGYAQRQRTRADWLVPLPDGLTTRDAMSIGTAGLTSVLCLMALEDGGVRPEDGPVLVTGAAGGVGSVAVALLADAGYEVTAVTGREETHDYLRGLGASAFLGRDEMSDRARPLDSEIWAGAVDTVGGDMLACLLPVLAQEGCVAACGVVGGAEVATSVYPFILRGVTLRGIDSAWCSLQRRKEIWNRLANQWRLAELGKISRSVPLSEAGQVASQMLEGAHSGRTIIEV